MAPQYVPGEGNPYAKLMLVGEAPGKQEDLKGRPFVGPSGMILDELLEGIGLNRKDIWLTNVYKYRPPDNKIHLIKQVIPDPIAHIEEGLFKEIADINPNCILALGSTALNTLCHRQGNITDLRGSILLSQKTGKKVVPSYHPAAFLHSSDEVTLVPYSHKYVSQFDFQRAYQESLTPEYDIPNPRIEIFRNSADCLKFFETYEKEKYVSIDIEVIKAIPVSIAFAYNDYHAGVFPLNNLGGMQFEWFLPTEELVAMQELAIDAINRVEFIIGQNFKFDQVKIEDTTGWGRYLRSLHGRIRDCTILAHALYPEFPKKLAFLSSLFTRHPYYKDEGKEFNWRKNNFKQFFLYNGKDAIAQYEVYFELVKELKELSKELRNYGWEDWYTEFVENHENLKHDFYMNIDKVGLLVDKEIKRSYFKKYTELYNEQRAELNKVAEFECNPHSPRDVPLLLYNELKLPRRKDCSRQTLVALLNNVAKKERQKKAIELVLSTRQIRKARNTYYGAKLDYDGRMRTSYNPNGTETGRSSSNILKPPVRPEKIGLAFQTMTKHGEIGSELREIFIPDPGYVFVEIDLSQAEARVVALLARDYELLEKFEKGIDVHSEMAYTILGKRWDGTTRAPKADRFIGKMGRHARNYDVGKRAFMQQVNAEAKKQGVNLNISEFRAGKILESVRAATPKVDQIFHEEIKAYLQDYGFLINPFGRYRKFHGRWDQELLKEAYANLPQGTVIDHLRRACYAAVPRLRHDGFKFVIESHDAIVSLVRTEYVSEYASVMSSELHKPINFARCSLSRTELVIPCEISIGTKNLKEMKPYCIEAVA